jgi:hypothetical protein
MALDREKDKNDLMPGELLDDRAYSQFLRERSAILRAQAEAFRQIARDRLLSRLSIALGHCRTSN